LSTPSGAQLILPSSPPQQMVPMAHALPQPPQSLLVLMARQPPLQQASFLAQVMPQPPQLLGSLNTSTQALLQQVWPVLQPPLVPQRH
jgi:hypothetical protein